MQTVDCTIMHMHLYTYSTCTLNCHFYIGVKTLELQVKLYMCMDVYMYNTTTCNYMYMYMYICTLYTFKALLAHIQSGTHMESVFCEGHWKPAGQWVQFVWLPVEKEPDRQATITASEREGQAL